MAAEFKDPVSASRHAIRQRDDWPKLLAGVETGHADVIWLWESSRGDRTLAASRQGIQVAAWDEAELSVKIADEERSRGWPC